MKIYNIFILGFFILQLMCPAIYCQEGVVSLKLKEFKKYEQYKQERDSLQTECEKLKAINERLQQFVQQLKTQVGSSDEKEKSTERQKGKAANDLAANVSSDIQVRLDSLNDLRPLAIKFTKDYIEEKEDYLQQPFAAMDTLQIANFIRQGSISLFKKNEAIVGIVNKLVEVQGQVQNYNSWIRPLYVPYNETMVQESIKKLDEMKGGCTERQQQDIDVQISHLSDYEYALSCMRSLILNINDDRKPYTGQQLGSGLLENKKNEYLEQIDSQAEFVVMVPYMKKIFDDYRAVIAKDPFGDTLDIEKKLGF